MVLNVVFLLLFLNLGILTVNGDICTWDNCPAYTNDGKINIHLIAHTHDDMGWIKTADDYFTGANAQLEHHGVQYIIDTMVEGLKRNKERKFTYAEVGYLTRWMETRSQEEVRDLINLVQNGQLEFSGGGWVQPDEGASHYVDLIDQYTLGLRKLNATFGTTCGHPKIGWQLDPFGHSREHGNILAMLGYEALYVARIHHLEQDVRVRNKTLEFNWYPSSENPSRKLFTGSLINLYTDPPSFCFDADCGDPPVIANPKFENYNADDVIRRLKAYVDFRVPTIPHNHILFPMGSDFHYQAAEKNFRNLDNLIKVVRQKTNYTIFYSTPACYTKAVQESGVAWTTKTADFFPYASGTDSFWTGYFTSKPACKGLIRQSSNIMNAMRMFNAFALPSQRNEHNTPEEKLERACGLAQHHDAVPGTCKEHVTQDYNYRLLQGWTAAEGVFQESLQAISQKVKGNTQQFPSQVYCRYLNESSCDFTKANVKGFSILIVNGHSQPVSQLIRIPIYNALVALIDENNAEVNSAWILPTFINGNQLPNNNISPYDLQFIADLPANGFKTYFIESLSKDKTERKAVKLHKEEEQVQGSPKASSINNGIITINFDNNNMISSVTNSQSGKTYPFKQSLLAYKGHDNIGPASGAYILRPQVNTPEVVNAQPSLTTTYLEARQVYSDWLSQTIRLVPNKTYIEFEWTVGPIPKTVTGFLEYGREVIARYEAPSIKSNKQFYTDSNGRQMIQRIRDYNQDFNVQNSAEPVASNMYPVNSRAMIKDDQTAFTVLTDRSQAGGSIIDSTLDLLLHRRDFYDDGWGVNEALNEPGSDGRGLVVRGRHRIFFSDPQSAANLHRQGAFEIFHSPIISFSNYDNVPNYASKYVTTFSGLAKALPQNVHLLTLKQLDASTLLVRLEHIFGKDEDSVLSQPATVDLTTLFKQFKIVNAQELTLGANLVVSGSGSMIVTLNPQDIKTFQVSVTPQ
jgi:lysosomal alpha-mannosidase